MSSNAVGTGQGIRLNRALSERPSGQDLPTLIPLDSC